MVVIFDHEGSSHEESLCVNDDSTLTYDRSNSGWRMAKRGNEPIRETLTPEEAKRRWPCHATKIDAAVAKVTAENDVGPDKA